LLTTIGYQLGPDEAPQYALEGSIAIGGAGVSWLRDQLGLIESAEESEAIASSVNNTAGKQDLSLSSYFFSKRKFCDVSQPLLVMVHQMQSLDVGWQSRTVLACLGSALNTNHSTHDYMFPAECLLDGTCSLFRFSADRPKMHLTDVCGNNWRTQKRFKSTASKLTSVLMQVCILYQPSGAY